MIRNITIPLDDFKDFELHPEHNAWLKKYLNLIYDNIELGLVSSSICLQGILSEICINGHPMNQWIDIMDDYLIDNDEILAYSHDYGNLLYKFESQWRQSPIYAIYTRWWIERLYNASGVSNFSFAKLIEKHIQPSGWIYNKNVSPTNISKRIKCELFMSLAMGIQILSYYNQITPYIPLFESLLSSEPLTPYISAEYFRSMALKELDSVNLAPVSVENTLIDCQSEFGFSDFSLKSKNDEYMGTKSRTKRDTVINSPLVSLYALEISKNYPNLTKIDVPGKLMDYGEHLYCNPLAIPAFQMREIEIPFGTDITPLELISASYIISFRSRKYSDGENDL